VLIGPITAMVIASTIMDYNVTSILIRTYGIANRLFHLWPATTLSSILINERREVHSMLTEISSIAARLRSSCIMATGTMWYHSVIQLKTSNCWIYHQKAIISRGRLIDSMLVSSENTQD
jgi:hypothetical protein